MEFGKFLKTEIIMWMASMNWQKISNRIFGTIFVFVLVAIALFGYNYSWTGFNGFQSPSDWQPAKTLWDWMELLLVPLILAIGGYWWNSSERKQEREIALNQLRDKNLQEYLQRVTSLLAEGKLDGKDSVPVRQVLRAQTLMVFGLLDGDRKALLVRFLYDAKLILAPNPIIDLSQASLDEANFAKKKILKGINEGFRPAHLEKANLNRVDLNNANLDSADLKDAQLHVARLTNADLSNANLENANLQVASLERANLLCANLKNANLKGALLLGANLNSADLSGADLSGAWLTSEGTMFEYLGDANLLNVNLEGANLKGARLKAKQLRWAHSLKGATMPDGSVFK